MKRLTIISDTHLASPDINSLSVFPLYMRKHPNRYPQLVAEFESYHTQVLAKLYENRPHDVFIHMGDVVSGWQESGLAHPDMLAIAEEAVRSYKTMSFSFHVCWGDHDTGFRGFKGRYGDISLESLRACQNLSPLWWSEFVDGMLFIGITSPLALYKGKDPDILALQREQEGFIYTTLQSLRGAKWMICSHQRNVMPSLAQAVSEHRDSFTGLIHGHEHNPRTAKFLDIFRPIRGKFANKTLIACPSIAPLWWRGAGYLSAMIGRGGELNTVMEHVPVKETKKPLFASTIKCLYWCVVAR